jgi:hypothetical protein
LPGACGLPLTTQHSAKRNGREVNNNKVQATKEGGASGPTPVSTPPLAMRSGAPYDISRNAPCRSPGLDVRSPPKHRHSRTSCGGQRKILITNMVSYEQRIQMVWNRPKHAGQPSAGSGTGGADPASPAAFFHVRLKQQLSTSSQSVQPVQAALDVLATLLIICLRQGVARVGCMRHHSSLPLDTDQNNGSGSFSFRTGSFHNGTGV